LKRETPDIISRSGSKEFRPPVWNILALGPELQTPELIMSSPSRSSTQSKTILFEVLSGV